MKIMFALALACSLAAVVGSSAVAADASPKGEKLLRHVVLFKFKDACTPEDIKRVTDAFSALPKKIDVIQGFEWGTDVGVEKLDDGFTHCFLVTFKDTKGRDAYLPHPAHEEFKKLVVPMLAKALVVDYWAKD
jgi:Stress responsive A/B Barrel Domain